MGRAFERITLSTCCCIAGMVFILSVVGAIRADEATPTPEVNDTQAGTDGGAGQSDLDEAIRLRVTAQSMADLERIIELGESAIQKGLDKDTAEFARQLVAASLLQHATRLSQDLLDARNAADAAAHLHRFALKDLEKAATYDDQLGGVYLLMAKLQSMVREMAPDARQSAEKAIERLQRPEQRMELSSALVVRASLTDDNTQRIADLTRAIELHPHNEQALSARGTAYATDDKIEEALRDFEQLLKINDKNLDAIQKLVQLFEKKEDHEKALEQIEKAIKIAPNSPGTYFLRAQIRIAQKQLDLALEDYDRVIRLSPNEIQFGLHVKKAQECLQPYIDEMPAEAAQKYHKSAVDDLTKALQLKPGNEDALLLRAIAYGVLKQFGPAIADLRGLIQLNPDKVEFQLQLAAFLVRDERPRKAIEVYDRILEQNDTFDRARLGRADALLSVGEHAQAIAEYEKLLAKEPQDVLESILNNFAWVLATSPDDQLRDGKRSIELALRACEISEYKQPHILSTLAAGYAESKDFALARQWSEKAVELGKNHPDVEQLKSELDSYNRGQPWREKELVKEKEEPELPSGIDLDSINDEADKENDADPDLLEQDGQPNAADENVDDDGDDQNK